jgi:MFS family permease
VANASARVVGLTGVGHAASHAWELVFPAVAIPLARDFGVTFEEAVALAWPLYLLFGFGAPVAGWASDRYGARRVLLACLIGGGFSGIAVAASTSTTTLVASLAALGFFASLYHPSGLALLSVWFEGKIGRAFAINGIAGNVGIAGTPIVAGIVASLWGWRAAYVVFCAPVLVVGLVFALLPFERRERDDDADPGAPVASGVSNDWRPLVGMAVAVTVGGLVYRLHTLVMPALIAERIPFLVTWTRALGLENVENVDNLAATALVSAAYAMGIFGQWWGGKIADRYRLVSAYFAFHLAALPLLLGAAWFAGWPLLLCLFFYIFFGIGMQPIENSLVAWLSPSKWRGRAYAGKFVLGFGVGSIGTYVVGWVAPYGGLGAALFVAVALEVVLLAAVVYVSRRTAES